MVAEQVGWSLDQVAACVASHLADSWVVNLGTGMPTRLLGQVPRERDVVFHSENGIVGMTAIVDEAPDPDLVSAGKEPVALVPGGSFVHHADSFALIRGGHVDAAVMGAYQVSAAGDLANWRLPGEQLGSIGGAMDIATHVPRLFAMMRHRASDGSSKIVERLTYPLTALGAVTRVFTDLAVLTVTAGGLLVDHLAPDITADLLRERTEAPLTFPDAGCASRSDRCGWP